MHTMSTNDPLPRLRGFARIRFLAGKMFEYCMRYSTNPYYLFLYLTRVLSASYKESVSFMGEATLLREARERSTIRLGDGEFGLITGKRGIHFQSADEKLCLSLKNILRAYDERMSPYLLGVNPQIDVPNAVLDQYGMKYLFMPQKLGFRLYAPRHTRYFNASYFYIDTRVATFLDHVSKGRTVIVVTNQRTATHVRQHEAILFPNATEIAYVETSAQNAFAEYDELLAKTRAQYTDMPTVAYVACGPAGKVLVHDLAHMGLLAHDVGHGLDFAVDPTSKEHLIRWDIFKSFWKPESK
jgi:hypothetical protein